MEKNLTTGNIFKTILYFALPYLLSYFMQTLYGMADLYITGKYNGVSSITAVSNGSQIMHMITVVIIGLAMGTTVMTGKSIGGKNKRQASEVIGNTITLFTIFAVVITVVLLLFVNPIVSLIGTPKEAVNETVGYLVICFMGIPFVTAYNIISSIFRGLGDSKSPMYFIGIACVLNIALDYLFIGFLDMGVNGAALGTTLSQMISVVIALVVIKRYNMGIELHKHDLLLKKGVLGNILKIGIPVAVQDGFIQVSFIVITAIVNKRGLNDAAAVGIVEKLISILFIVPSSMLATVSALSAQNIGAGKHKRAVKVLKYSTLITVIYGLTVTLIISLNLKTVIGLFTKDMAVIVPGAQYLRSYVWDCIFAGVHFSFSGYFAACGKSYIGFLHNIIAIICVRIPGSYMASKCFSSTLLPMGMAAPAGSLLSVIICVTAYMILKKKYGE